MELLDLYLNIDYQILNEYIEKQQEENLYLEFKEISNAELSHKDDRRNFSKALSGFSNSDGGIIIWGVNARKNASGTDCACELKPINNLSLFISKLNGFTGQFITPIIEGVRHEKIEINTNNGFIKTFIPQSNSGPHMAKVADNKYYKRSGDSFYPMEHFDIEDMFGRRKKPKLEIFTKIKQGVSIGNNPECKVIICIRNTGKGLAKFPYLSLKIKYPYAISDYGLTGNYGHGLPRLPHSDQREKVIFGGDSNSVVHVNSELEVTIIKFYINKEKKEFREGGVLKDLEFDYEIAAEEISSEKGTYKIKKEEFLKIFNL